MGIFKALVAAIVVLLPLSQGVSAQGPECSSADFDAVRDFSLNSNPTGVWSYGWETSARGPLTLYPEASSACITGMGFWYASPKCYPPLVAHNDTDQQICWATLCVPPKYLILHPGPTGQMTVVRWTAPSDGLYGIRGKIEGLDYAGPTSTGFYAVMNSKVFLVRATIDSYKSPIIFHHRRRLLAGQTIDFVVDWGTNHNYGFDSTGVQFTVTPLGP